MLYCSELWTIELYLKKLEKESVASSAESDKYEFPENYELYLTRIYMNMHFII